MLIQKTTKEERIQNSACMDQILFSLHDTNTSGLKKVLCEDGVFLGKSKLKFLAELNTFFNKLDNKIKGTGIHGGICLDQFPGSEVLEVRYALSDDLLDENGLYWSIANSPKRKGEKILRFAFKFQAGKVVAISKTRRFLKLESVKYEEDICPN